MNKDYIENDLPEVYEGGDLADYDQSSLPAPQQMAKEIGEIASKVCDSITSWKQIDFQMHQMDVQFNTFVAKIDYELSMYRERIPVMEKQLDFVNTQISKILDHVLVMDAKTEDEIRMKTRLLDSSEKYLDNLANMMMKML